MEELNSFLESARKVLKDPSFNFIANEIWGSKNPEHRLLIHAQSAHIKSSHREIHTSITHCEGIGIVAYSRNPIGVDAEPTDRVQTKTAARVSTEDELVAAPSAASLWCAKEACFKALKSYHQPSVLSQISIGDWQKIDSHTETYRLTNPQSFHSPCENHGIVFRTLQHTCSFFIFRS